MRRLTLLLLVVLVVGTLVGISSVPASAQADQPAAAARAGEYPDVSKLQAFTAEANFMSRPGYLRLLVFREQGTWMSYAEAERIVKAQGG